MADTTKSGDERMQRIHATRRKTIGYIAAIISVNGDPGLDDITLAQNVELGVFKQMTNTLESFDMDNATHLSEYVHRAKGVIYNLRNALPAVREGTLGYDISDMANQSKLTLCPERWKGVIQRNEAELARTRTTPQETTDQFTCRQCKKNQTTYYLRQTRSADEPETVFITCTNCQHKWRQCG